MCLIFIFHFILALNASRPEHILFCVLRFLHPLSVVHLLLVRSFFFCLSLCLLISHTLVLYLRGSGGQKRQTDRHADDEESK